MSGFAFKIYLIFNWFADLNMIIIKRMNIAVSDSLQNKDHPNHIQTIGLTQRIIPPTNTPTFINLLFIALVVLVRLLVALN